MIKWWWNNNDILCYKKYIEKKGRILSLKIEIIQIPSGSEPQDIREAWVGVIFTVKKEERSRQCRYSFDENFLDIGSEVDVYRIPYKKAIRALKKFGRDEAYGYFTQNLEKLYHPQFIFYKDVYKKAVV